MGYLIGYYSEKRGRNKKINFFKKFFKKVLQFKKKYDIISKL